MTLFSLVAVLALAGMGLTYTLWSETLEVDGTVNTGTLDVSISGDTTEKVGVGGWVLGEDEIGDIPGWELKPAAANCDVQGSFVGTTGPGESGADNTLTVTVTDAYPSFYCIVTVTVTNDGSVPVHVNEPALVAGSTAGISGVGSLDAYVGNVDTDGDGDLDDTGCYADDVQLHNGDTASCEIVIHFENADNLNEGSTGVYTFTYEILAHQWNEEA